MVPVVPCTSSVESPLIAAARCSLTHVFAVPGTPSSNSALSVTSVATAISTSRCWPTYFGTITVPSDSDPPIRYCTTAQGDNFQPGGRSRSSSAASAANSCAYCSSACGRSTSAACGDVPLTISDITQALSHPRSPLPHPGICRESDSQRSFPDKFRVDGTWPARNDFTPDLSIDLSNVSTDYS